MVSTVRQHQCARTHTARTEQRCGLLRASETRKMGERHEGPSSLKYLDDKSSAGTRFVGISDWPVCSLSAQFNRQGNTLPRAGQFIQKNNRLGGKRDRNKWIREYF